MQTFRIIVNQTTQSYNVVVKNIIRSYVIQANSIRWKSLGERGPAGRDGKSAFELSQDAGFTGSLDDFTKAQKGKDGYTPIKGVDYFDGSRGVDGYTPIKGKDYFDGHTPVKNVDYFDGRDGNTPYIQDGNWWISQLDTGISANGIAGISPNIGTNGNWFIGTTDTGVYAQGPAGDPTLLLDDTQVSLTKTYSSSYINSNYERIIGLGNSNQYFNGLKQWVNFPTIPTQYTDTMARAAQYTANGTTTGLLTYTDFLVFNAKVTFPGFGTSHVTAAYGDHSHSGIYQPVGSYLTSYTETDPIFTAWNKSTGISITKSQVLDFPTQLSQFTNNLGNYGGYLTSITSSQITTALGFTPYNATNPNNYISSITSSQITNALGSQTANMVYASPNGSAGNPSFRYLQSADIPSGVNAYIWNQTSQQSATINVSGSVTGTGGLFKSDYYMSSPNGGLFITSNGGFTGAITITLPASIGATMTSMWIDVYNYAADTSFSVQVGGYTYTGNTWANSPFAIVYGADYTVRLGHNGTNFVIYIGETSTTWSYPQVSVRDIILGYAASTTNWKNSIGVSFSTSFLNVTATCTTKAWTTKNFSPSNYLPLTGGSLSGSLNITGSNWLNMTTATYSNVAILTGNWVGAGIWGFGNENGHILKFDQVSGQAFQGASDITLKLGTKTVIDSSSIGAQSVNYASTAGSAGYAGSANGISLGTAITNLNTFYTSNGNSIQFAQYGVGTTGIPTFNSAAFDGFVMNFNWYSTNANSYGSQIAFGNDSASGQEEIAFRGRDINGNQGTWKQIFHSGNIASLQTAFGTPWTSAGYLASSAASYVTNGYQKLSNGFIIQWGQATANNTVYFPVAFTTRVFYIGGSNISNNNTEAFSITSLTLSSFYFNEYGKTNTGNWLAMGY